MNDTDKSELDTQLEDFIHDYKVNTPDGWEWKKLVELDEVKKFLTQQCNQARIDERNHFKTMLDNHDVNKTMSGLYAEIEHRTIRDLAQAKETEK